MQFVKGICCLLVFCLVQMVHAEKVAVIGGGASGLTTAWLLDKTHDVTLYEAQERLGGHANTVEVTLDSGTHLVEAGAEFFNTTAYPHFLRLLTFLGVSVAGFSIVSTFYNPAQQTRFTLPPVHDGQVEWHSFKPSNLMTMLMLKYVMLKAGTLFQNKDATQSLEDFLNPLWLTEGFKQYLYLFLGSNFGLSANEAKHMQAYYALRYMMMGEHTQWLEATEGLKSYVKALEEQMDTTHIEKNTAIDRISKTSEGKYRVIKDNGESEIFDKVVMATNASSTAKLMRDLSGCEDLVDAFERVNYIEATLAIHGDESFLPEKASHRHLINIRSDGQKASMTMQKHTNVPIYKSWIEEGENPTPCYSRHKYQHIVNDNNYPAAQKTVKKAQGQDGLFFAGIWTNNGDSHEEAILSAMEVAKHLAPDSERLRTLMGDAQI